MGKTKNPDEVEEKNFSDSLELFDSLFQEELEDGSDGKSPLKGSTAVRPTAPKAPSNQQTKIDPKVAQKKQPSGPASKPALKRKTATPLTTHQQEIVDTGIDSEAGGATAEWKPVPDIKAPSTEKQDTLEMAKKGTQPRLEPEDVTEISEVEREFVPQGIILKGINRINAPTSSPAATSAAPDKVGKLYTPKESKSLLSGVSIKESNLYKVVLAGFAFAIVVMVLINFFGIMGSDDSRKTSNPVKKAVAEKSPAKKRPAVAANKPKASRQKKSPGKIQNENRLAQKKSPGPASTPKANQITTKPNIKTTPGTTATPDSKPQPKTILVNRDQVQQDNQVQALVPKSAPQPDSAIRTPAPASSPPKTPDSPFSSPENSSTVVETTSKKSTPEEKSLEPVVATRTETMTPPAPVPSPPVVQKTADKRVAAPKVVERAFPYSVYLGAYKTLERAKVAVSLYQDQGLSTYWVEVDLGSKGTWFRIFTGHFQDEDEAQDFIDQRDLEEASVKRTRYSALIGVFSSKDAIERKSEALLKLGYSAYAIEGGNGTSQLYTGAFYTKSGAEKLQMELEDRGIPNQVVER